MTIFKKISYLLTLSILLLGFSFAFAQDSGQIDTDLTSENTTVHVGDSVSVLLHVYPPSDAEPIYTVSATAFYDTQLLSYQNSRFASLNWFPLNRAPYVLEDTTQGMIRKTAGYPKGLKTDSDFIVYTFKALTPGVATVSLEDGLALDQYNDETKVAPRKIYIRILPNENVATSTQPVTKPADTQVVKVNMKVNGRTAFYMQDDYTMTVNQDSVGTDTVSTTIVEIYDQDYNKVWSKDLTYLANSDKQLQFTVPAYTLKPGDYIVSVKSIFSDGSIQVLDEKYIGVLDNGDGYFGKYKVLIIACFLFLALFAIFHHMMMDEDVYQEDEKLKKQLKSILKKKRK